MSADEPVSADLPELRLVAQLAGIAPSKLAAGLNDPEHILDHLAPDEFYRCADGLRRFLAFERRMDAALDTALTHITKARSN